MSPRFRTLLLTTTALWALGAAPAMAGPDGPNVVGGSATVSGAGTSSVQINQSSQRAIINWNTFNIRQGETTTFAQPNSSSVTLNRVTGGLGPSEIYGTLNANGQVFVINRDGVLIGPTGTINTAGFLATTHDIKNSDFMAGRYNFNIPGRPDASIVNQGTITATTGGFAALVAPGVRNSGTITATLGTVALASGNTFTLDLYGDKLIQLSPSDQIAAKVIDIQTGKPISSLVSNDGKLSANGGRVELSAAAARAVVDSVINTRGVIEANSVGTRNGKIVLGAATGDSKGAGLPKQTVKVSGTISASGKQKGAKGGTVVVTGEDIQVSNARIDVSGDAGGGKLLLGGDWGGGHPTVTVNNQSATLEGYPIANATTLSVDSTTTIDASARSSGNGGKVILWSNSQTTFAGTIFATGGDASGNGGFVEVSSKGQLAYAGTVDTRAPNGTTGTLLLDPFDVIITGGDHGSIGGLFSGGDPSIWTPTASSNINVFNLVSQLQSTNVIITTSSPVGQELGNITVATDVSWQSKNTLTLQADNNIAINASITATSGGLTLQAANAISASGAINVGTFTLASGNWSQVGANLPAFAAQDFRISGGSFLRATGGDGSSATPYQIADVYGLQGIGTSAALRGSSYGLANNIDAAVTSGWNGGDGFVPIGSIGIGGFTGSLNGQGNSIDKLTIAPTSGRNNDIGLFGTIYGSVSNLKLTNVSVTADPNVQGPGQFVGALSGSNAGTITNVSATGTVNGIPLNDGSPVNLTGVIAGGLVGQNGVFGQGEFGQTVSPGTITNSHANVTVTVGDGNGCQGDCVSAFNIAGGLVGSNVGGSTISNSYATGNVTAGAFSFAGGLAGQNGFDDSTLSSITSSYASGNVTITGDQSAAGGLVGSNGLGSTITDSQAFGAVTSSFNATEHGSFTNAGGLVGQNNGTITSTTQPTAFSTCASGAAFSCAAGTVSVGTNGAGGGLAGNNTGTIEKSFAIGSVTGADGLTVNGGTTLGGLVGQSAGPISNSFATGNVTGGNATLAGGLVGSNDQSDGATVTISNSFATGSVTVGNTSVGAGLVAVSNGTITNSSASVGEIKGGSDSIVAGLVGAFGLQDGTITGSSASGNVTSQGSNSMVGGFVGLNAGILDGTNSATGAVTGSSNSYIGGFVGFNIGRIDGVHSTASAAVTGTGNFNAVGGLVGGNAGTITSSSAMRTVSGQDSSAVGGLVGTNTALEISGDLSIPSYTTFPVGTISNSSAGGTVSAGSFSYVGGLAGVNGGTISNSSASATVSGGSLSWTGGLVGWNGGLISIPFAGVLAGCDVDVCDTLVRSQITQGPSTITGSSATGPVGGGATSFTGGFAGLNFGSINLSFATGPTSGQASSIVGGFVGLNVGSINQSYAGRGAVSGGDNSFVGGFVGINANIQGNGAVFPGSITQAYELGPVTGGNAAVAAGFAALNLGKLDQVYAVGLVSIGAGGKSGGLVALNSGTLPSFPGGSTSIPSAGVSVTNSYWDRQTTGQETSAGGTAMDTAVLAGAVPPGFDPTIWTHGSYPHLINLGTQDTNPGPPVLPPDTPPEPNPPSIPANQQTPAQLQLVQNVQINVPASPPDLVNTQVALTGPPQPPQTVQSQADSNATGSINSPIQLNVGDGRYFFLPPPEETRIVANEVVIQLPCDTAQQTLGTALSELQLTVLSTQCLSTTNMALYRLQMGDDKKLADVIRALANYRIVVAAQANYVFIATQDPASLGNQPQEGDSGQYVLEKLRLIDIHRRIKASNVPIAVIDSQIDTNHPDLAGAVVNQYDATGTDEKPHPHGTGMAGAIASHHRLVGIAPGAHILAIRAFSTKASSAESTSFNILKGLDYAIHNNVRIVNMSFAGPRDPELERALKTAYDKGIVLIAAAGNAGPKSPPLYPAADKNVIAVTATDIDDKLFSGANRGNYIAVAAPGVDILVPAPAATYQMTTGTSVATAHVSGLVALMLERNPRLTPADVRRILIQSAKKLGPNDQFGAGLIDPVKALQLAAPRSAEASPTVHAAAPVALRR